MPDLFANRPRAAFFCQLAAVFIIGAFSSLAMAPYDLWPVLFITLSGFYFTLSRSTTAKTAFGYGFVFAFGYFVFGLFWVGEAFLVDGSPWRWAYPFIVSGLPVVLSFFFGFAALAAYKFSDLKKISGFLSFSALLILFEWLRGHILSGFPWNLFGYIWRDHLEMIQITALGNIYTLTWLTILWCALPGFLLTGTAARRHKVLLGFVAALILAMNYGYGAWRLSAYPTKMRDDIMLKIVQANIPQHEKWDSSKMMDHFVKHVKMSLPADSASEKTTFIIWPETAVTRGVMQAPGALNLITQTLNSYDAPAYLLTGMLRYEENTDRYYNSHVMIDSAGGMSNIYDKHHLVPLGEFIPLQEWIPLRPVAAFKGFERGDGPMVFETPANMTYSPLVCYEVIFPDSVYPPKTSPPDLIVNVTNDAWYGEGSGPRQHFTHAVFRAVEEGVPFIRVANTGISGLIDPLGRILIQSRLSEEFIQDMPLPEPLDLQKNHWLKNAVFFLLIAVFVSFGWRQNNKL